MYPLAAGSAAAVDFQYIERAGMPVLYAMRFTVFAHEGLQLWLAEVVIPFWAGGCSRGEGLRADYEQAMRILGMK
jgi:hypothetical protein